MRWVLLVAIIGWIGCSEGQIVAEDGNPDDAGADGHLGGDVNPGDAGADGHLGDDGNGNGNDDGNVDGSDDGGAVADDGNGDDGGTVTGSECEDWQSRHPEWIFCDDFEGWGAMVGQGRYFEYGDNGGDCVPVAGVGYEGSTGMQVRWQAGEVGAGGMKLGFGRNPNNYMNKGIRAGEDFREIWYRMYLKMEPGWTGSPAKLSRATVFTSSSDWSQAMIAHLWSGGNEELLLDPVRCVDDSSNVKCQGYNDFDHMDWLGIHRGTTRIFSTQNSGTWFCVEAHVRLNDPGSANGVHEFWIDGNLEARAEGLNFVRSYTDYALNAVFFENYWNSGSPKEQERYFDNIVVSTAPVGCL